MRYRLNRKDIIEKLVRSLLEQKEEGGIVIDLSQRYHVITAKDELLLSTNDFHQAWKQIKGQKHGTRLLRSDGQLLAFASTAGGGRIKKGFPKEAIFRKAEEGTSEEAPSG